MRRLDQALASVAPGFRGRTGAGGAVGSGTCPFLTTSALQMSPSSTATLTLDGYNFEPGVIVTLVHQMTGLPGATVMAVTSVTPVQIVMDVATTGLTGAYNVRITNPGGCSNDAWMPGNNGVGVLDVSVSN